LDFSPIDPAAASQILQDALALHRQGKLSLAMERYVKVLQGDPKNADALYYIAVVAAQEGQFPEAIKLAQRANAFGPPQARVHNLLGQTFLRLGQAQEALASFDRAIALQPDFADAHGNRANLLAELGYTGEAMAGFDRALALRPDSPEDWCNRGATLQDLNRFDEALESYDRAIALRPDFAGAYYNHANILRDLGQMDDARGLRDSARLDAAEDSYNKAIGLDPQFMEALFGRALVHLLRGNWDAGWRDYESRSRVGEPTYAPLPYPLWKGEPLPNERLVLVTEQGLGDAINFCRFAPLLAARGYDVTILTKPSMQALLSTLPGVMIATSADQLAQDKRPIRWLPIMGLAGVLGVQPLTIPADVPYLSASPERIKAWAEPFSTSSFKIGINWASGHPNNRHFAKRNIPLAVFSVLAALPGVQLFSLQKGPEAGQITQVAFRDRIIVLNTDPAPDADLFLDTAAVMTHLDLIVSCDTSVAHLAGALARPVFTALPMIADWRWLLGRNDSPWYPTMRLFRQKKPGDWTDVIERIAAEVCALAVRA
jgi:tetratricopeptide (TPR) repeat protein